MSMSFLSGVWSKITCLEYGSVSADVTTGGETEATNEAGAEV